MLCVSKTRSMRLTRKLRKFEIASRPKENNHDLQSFIIIIRMLRQQYTYEFYEMLASCASHE